MPGSVARPHLAACQQRILDRRSNAGKIRGGASKLNQLVVRRPYVSHWYGALIRLLINLRLRWYALATGRLLRRHWQAIVLAVGVLSPVSMPILLQIKFIASPVLEVFSPGHTIAWRILYITLMQAVAFTWVAIQRSNISGGSFMTYGNAFPISPSQWRRVDLIVLLFADSLLLVPVFTTVVVILTSHVGMGQSAFQVSVVGTLFLLMLVTQLGVLERRSSVLLGVLPTSVLLSLSLDRPVGVLSWLMLAGSLLIAVSFLLNLHPVRRFPNVSLHNAQTKQMKRLQWSVVRLIPSALLIQIQTLFFEHLGATILRLSAALGIALSAAWLIRLFEFDARALPTAIIALAAIALISSGLYRILYSVHAPVRPFLATLPISRNFWTVRDTALVMALGAVPMGVLFYPLSDSDIFSMLTLVALAIAYQSLLVLLRLPLLYGGRQSVLLGVILAGTWSGAAMAAIR